MAISRAAATPASAVAAAPVPPPAPAASRPVARDAAGILAGGAAPAPAKSATPAADAFIFFVQAGAYTRSEDADQQRARLALIGQSAKVTEREQAGRTVYRVRLGPFPTRDEADALQTRLQEASIETQIVRVEKQ